MFIGSKQKLTLISYSDKYFSTFYLGGHFASVKGDQFPLAEGVILDWSNWVIYNRIFHTAAIYEKAKAQAYSQSVEKLESELSETISGAYDSAIKSLTTQGIMGYDQFLLSKEQANKVVADMFSVIRNSPELYKQESEIEKLITDSMSKAYSGAGRNLDTSMKSLNNFPQLEGMINGVKDYAKAFSILPEKQEEFFSKNEALFGANINYAKSIEEITKKHEDLTLELSKQKFISEDDSTAAKTELQKKRLEEMVAVYKKFGQLKLADDIQKELDKLNNATVGWRVELQKVLGNTIQINADSNINDVMKEMKDKYKDIKTRMDEQKPILLKAKFDFTSMSFPSPLVVSESMRQIGANFKVDSDDANMLAEAVKLLNMQLSNLYSPKEKGGGSKKDKFTDDLKRKIDLIKDAKKEYDELLKLMSKEDAFKKLTSITEYKDVKQSDISSNGYTDYLKSIINQLESHIKKNPKSDTAKNLLVALTKEVGGIQIGEITKKAKDEIDKIEKYLSQHKENFNLYKQIFDITGDKGKAAQIVFGDPAASIETYIDAMKSQLKVMSGGGIYEDLLKVDQSTLTEPVQKMVEDIREAIQEQDFTLKVDMAKIIADYATTEEKITAIHNRYEKLREEARKSNASQFDKDKAVAAYDSAEHKEISELQDELLKLTPFYRQLFADLSDIGYRHLKKLSENARGIVDTITNTKVQTPQGERLKYGQYDESGKQTGYYLPNEDGSVSKTVVSLKEYESILRKIASIQKGMNKENPFQSLTSSPDSEQYKNADGTKKDSVDIMASKMGDLNSIVQSVGGELAGMFDALGNKEAADTTAFIGEMVGAASNVAMGIASGNPVQVIQGIIGGITSIAKNHDKKLDRAIEKSKLKVKGLQNAYSDLERFLSRQLGAVTSKQAKDQIKNLEAQRREIQSQMRNEQDKKKTDDGAVLDYQNQISELNDKIRYFYEDLAGEQFGIKIKDWAKNISDSLVDAWSKGEDAAKAFDKSVADIMKSVFKNVLQLQYIEPAMKKLRKYLFGDDGKGGVLGDGELSQSDMKGLVNQLASLKGDLNQWKTAWDYLTQAAKQAGIDLEEQVSSDETLSKGIEAVTEDTASLLASYINTMRADLSMQRAFVYRILQNSDRNTNTFALMQADIMLIQMNTLRTANNTDRLVELGEDTFSILRNASIGGSGIKFNVN